MKTFKKLMQAALALMLVGCSAQGNTTTTTETTAPTAAAEETTETTAPAATTDTSVVLNATEPVDRIVMAVTSTATDVSPYGAMSQTRTFVQQALYAQLFFIQSGHFLEDAQPYVGKSITKVDDYTYDIEIYDNVVDSKGNPIKASDIKFSFEKSAELHGFTAFANSVESFDIQDDTHFTLKLNTKVPGTIEILVCSAPISIVNQEWYENATDEEMASDPATTGPYKVKSLISGTEIVLEARQDYWKTDKAEMNLNEHRNVNEVVMKVVTEESMRAIGLETGELDFASVGVTNLHRFYENGEAKTATMYGSDRQTLPSHVHISTWIRTEAPSSQRMSI